LEGSSFTGAEIVHSRFTDTQTQRCDFRDARIRACDFRRANLQYCRFGGAILDAVDLRKANLAGARGLTAEQLLQTLTDETTILPNGTPGPYLRRSGAERPRSAGLDEEDR
jgi:uncharacterized protein YjbI with pentapeptide repeats